jgi:hypothetical protein
VEVVCRGREPGELDVERDALTVVVRGWPTSTLEVRSSGEPIWRTTLEVPRAPDGVDQDEYLERINFGVQPLTEEQWAEILRRDREMEDGTVPGIPYDEVMRELRERFQFD